MKFPLFVLTLLLSAISLNAQQLDHVLGEILIELEKGATPDRLVSELAFFEGEPNPMAAKQVIWQPMNIWLLQFDQNKINEKSLLHNIQARRDVLTSQYNHLIHPRLEPNDPQFVSQWQYINDGSFGVEGADIDMDLAWDISTGGMTANGDEIVACVVDDGLDSSHSDFGDNVWVNDAEIPNNGIDDDNNGYIDDYNGWDAFSDSDQVFDGGGHGTPVAGIIGAQGNNEIGVSGVNWDIKLMIVQGGGNEAQALAAYAYPYAFRKLYNETNGEEGAFVVVTNSSWGIDFGQPSEAPLWCNFYDSLGTVGILNCGATINGDFDVDVIGDLPTGCDSDFLISVTNMNSSDNKVNQAGYGATTVDLGAFGHETWTTSFGNSYNGFGGTSGATPHVAGTVALAYSVQCAQLADLAVSDPGTAALFIRDMILQGVDHNESLEGITVTEGRLNAFNTLSMVQTACSACPPPFGFTASGVTDVNASISWVEPDSASAYNLIVRPVGGDNWDTLINATTPLNFTDLSACTEYEIQVQTICQDTMSDFSSSFIFKTDGCCEIPETFTVEVGDSSATALWNDKLAAVSYILEYKSIDSSEWISTETVDTSILIDQFPECTTYEARLTMICNTNDTIMSDIITFIAGCGSCSSTEYCNGFNLGSFAVWIDTIIVDGIANGSGDNDGYADFAGEVEFSMRQDARFSLRLAQAYGPFEPPVIFSVWIDYNQNQEFEEEELAFTSDMPEFAPVEGFIDVPQEAKIGYTKMRVALRPFDPPFPCPDPDYFNGEVEDYCVWIGEEIFPCDLGFDVMVEDIGMTNATLTWTPLDSAIAYNIRYKALTEEFNDFAVLDTFYDINSLEKCTDYIAEVRAVCANDTSAYNSITFKTQCSTSTGDELLSLEELNIYPNPFNEDVFITFNLEEEMGDLRIEMIDLTGKLILQKKFNNIASGQNQISLNQLDQLIDGMYLIRIQSGGKQLVRKIVKANFY